MNEPLDILDTPDQDKPEIAKTIDRNRRHSGTVPLEVPFTPYDHTTANVPVDTALANFGTKYGSEIKKDVGYVEGVSAVLQRKNDTLGLIHGTWDRSEDYLLAYKDSNFNPLDYPDKFLNVNNEYQSYLLGSANDKQMDFRLNRIYHEQSVDDRVKNGSWMQFLTGSALAIPTDLITYIPVIGQMKYAKWGKTFLNATARNIPGGVAFGALSSAGEQVDRINGNLKDFFNGAVIRSVFATALFGSLPVLSLAADKLDLWKLQSYVGDAVKGIGYKLKVGEKGEVQGLQAYDMTPHKSLSSDVLKLAQDKADSSFYKGGLFKIPYIGTAAEKLMSNKFFGSTIMSMLLSPLKTVRAIGDYTVDHGIITQGMAEGKAKPIPFFSLMQQTLAHIRQEQDQFNALHMERNGVKTDSYIAQSALKAGMYTKQKTLEKIQAEIGDRPYISESEFSDEVQSVIRTEIPHENAAVNEAAAMFRKSMDTYYANWRKAYNLPDDWMPPKTANAYLMRVYDINYLNNNLYGTGGWIPVIANELRNQDNTIIRHLEPVRKIESDLEKAIAYKESLVEMVNVPDVAHKNAKEEIDALKAQKKAAEEHLQNEIRTNPELHLLAEDWNALSADEATELKQLLKRRDIAQKEVDERTELIKEIKEEAAQRKSASTQAKTTATAKKNKRKSDIGLLTLPEEEAKLAEVQKELDEEKAKLQEMAHSGKMNKRFYNRPKDSYTYVFRNPDERLKLRKTYHEQQGYIAEEDLAHSIRESDAKAYYDTIMNQTAEDTINQIMGKFTGNSTENHTKARTLNIPDEVLYQYNFLTKDLLSKVANYKIWLARRTNIKNVFQGVTYDDGFEPVIRQVQEEFDAIHTSLNQDKATLTEKLDNKDLTADEKKKLQKGLVQTENEIKNIRKAFNRGINQSQFAYEKMMGISKLTKTAKQITQGIKSFNVFANLGFLPITMITDLSANGQKQGLIPFIQSGVYPAIQSVGGLLKTHDSESLRNTAGAINLAAHHIGNTTASRQIDLSTNPYLNLGRIPAALDKIAHFASNINLTTAIDNGLQYITSAVAQSNVISHMKSFAEGKLTKGDLLWLNKYGLDPKKDAERILAAFKKDGGGSNKLGGYQSNFWLWEDKEIANKVGDAVFRSTHDTIISANALDAPMWLDENGGMNMLAPIIRGFKGWAFGSLNRYLIPALQTPDAQNLMGLALMTATASLVGPMRRIAKGEQPYADKNGKQMTDTQIIAEILLDSPQFAWISNGLQDANLLSGGSLLGDLKNSKYRDRARIGVLGPTASNANKLFNFIDAMASGDMNEHDVMGMASMIPVVNSLYGFNASQQVVEGWGLQKYRSK